MNKLIKRYKRIRWAWYVATGVFWGINVYARESGPFWLYVAAGLLTWISILQFGDYAEKQGEAQSDKKNGWEVYEPTT